MKLLFAIALLLFCIATQAQDTCNCLQNLDSVINKVTRNYAGYHDKVNTTTKEAYNKLVKSLQKEAVHNGTDSNCFRILKRYTGFFRDGHLGISLLKNSSHTSSDKSEAKPSKDIYAPSFLFPKKDWAILTFPSFDISYNDTIHKLFQQYHKELMSCRYWVVDIRGNDGGSSDCYAPLLPFLFTQPIVESGAGTWCSIDNVTASRQTFEDYKDQVDTITRNGWQKSIEKMESNVGKWMYSAGDTIVFNSVLQQPFFVAFLIDSGCASSSEILILKAKQSSKVKLFGTYTNGTIDYGDVLYWDDLPHHSFNLRIATARWNWIDTTGPIDITGIKPDVVINQKEKDWISYVMKNSKQQ